MKFREFKTSSGKIVLAGKDAKSNEELIKQAEKNEDVFHSAKPGSPFVNIKSSKTNAKDRKATTEGSRSPITKKDIREAAIFCALKSQDWRDNKKDVEVHWFNGKDVCKIKGMKLGTFGVKKYKKILVKKKEIEDFIKNSSKRVENK